MNGSRGAKGGRNDRKRVLKIKLAFLKKLKDKNNLKKKFKKINIINFNYSIHNPLVMGYKKYKINNIKKDNKIFDNIIMITSLLSFIVPEKKEKTSSEKKLERIEEAKIVENYSEDLKKLRVDLREKSFEEKIIEDNDEEKENDVDLVIDNLNVLIDKVDVLEEKIKDEDNDKYDSNYLYVIVDEYLKDFSDKKEVSDISSSDLYIDLADKIEKFNEKKEIINNDLKNKKEKLNITDDDIKKLKESYYKYEDYDKKMDDFASKTEEVLEDTKVKLNEQEDVEKKDKIKLDKADKISKLLLVLAAGELLLPMNRDAKELIVGTTITIFLLRNILFKNKYKLKSNIKESIIDYSKDIEGDILSIDNKINSINKSITDIDNMLSSLKNKYRHCNTSTEYINLLSRLEKIRNNLKEKLYILLKQRDKENNFLNINNSKVKKYN